MFNKKLVYSIRKLSIGIASVAVGAMLQTNIVHAQTGKTSELPPAATQPVTQPVAEDVEQPTGTDPVANTASPVVNETAQPQPRKVRLQLNLLRKQHLRHHFHHYLLWTQWAHRHFNYQQSFNTY